jgi:hypothetical protein
MIMTADYLALGLSVEKAEEKTKSRALIRGIHIAK